MHVTSCTVGCGAVRSAGFWYRGCLHSPPQGGKMLIRLCLLLLLSAVPASAQTLFQGRIDVVVHDPQGGVTPGATIEIAGPVSQSRVTDERGEAHFLNLPPGTYRVTSELQGFRPYDNDRVTVASGAGTMLRITLQV